MIQIAAFMTLMESAIARKEIAKKAKRTNDAKKTRSLIDFAGCGTSARD
jgi:hypothetical protein